MTKTEFMLIGSRQRLISTLTESPTFAINDLQVSLVSTVKSLGVTIDNRLDWSGHIKKVTKKVSSGIGVIKRIRHFVPLAATSKRVCSKPSILVLNLKGEKSHIT